MKIPSPFLLLIFVGFLSALVLGQTTSPLKRTTYKTDKFDFGSGGTLEITGAPFGSITIEGGNTNEVEISATIEVEAQNEADLTKLTSVTGFVLEESLGRTGITSTGINDKKLLKQLRERRKVAG